MQATVAYLHGGVTNPHAGLLNVATERPTKREAKRSPVMLLCVLGDNNEQVAGTKKLLFIKTQTYKCTLVDVKNCKTEQNNTFGSKEGNSCEGMHDSADTYHGMHNRCNV
jgi:hypothetical protein